MFPDRIQIGIWDGGGFAGPFDAAMVNGRPDLTLATYELFAADTVSIPRELLDALAPAEAMNQDEMGGCVWCAGTPPRQSYGYAGRRLIDHAEDCPWVAARAALGDPIPHGGRKR